MGLRASPAELSMWSYKKYFSHPSLVIYFSATLQIKLKGRHQIGERLLIANHLEQSSWWANQIMFITLLAECIAVPFTRHRKLHNYHEPKPISWSKPAYFRHFFYLFSSYNFTLQDHMMCTAWGCSTICTTSLKWLVHYNWI
jgi:hypothetical protein